MTFRVVALDAGATSELLKIGDVIPKTKWKLLKFTPKQAKSLEPADVSELTIANLETGQNLVLTVDGINDCPREYAEFEYDWNGRKIKFAVEKQKEFVLMPLVNERYRVLDIGRFEALVQAPDGKKVSVKAQAKAKE
jgi:hypothetical protein